MLKLRYLHLPGAEVSASTPPFPLADYPQARKLKGLVQPLEFF